MFKPKCDQCQQLLDERNAAVKKQINDAKALNSARAEIGLLRRKVRQLQESLQCNTIMPPAAQ